MKTPFSNLTFTPLTNRIQALTQIPLHQLIESLNHHYQTTLPQQLHQLVTQVDTNTSLTNPFDEQGQLRPDLAETVTGQEYLETERLLHYLAWLDEHWPQILQGLGLTLATGGGGLILRQIHRRGWWGKSIQRFTRNLNHKYTSSPQKTLDPEGSSAHQPPNPTTPFLHDLARSGQMMVILKIDVDFSDFQGNHADIFTWSGSLSWDEAEQIFTVTAPEQAIVFEPGTVKAATLSINDAGQTETTILLHPTFTTGADMFGSGEVSDETV